MRNGYRIFDADTHIKPSAEAVGPFFPKGFLDKIPNLQEQLTPIKVGMAGEQYEAPYRHLFRFAAPSEGGWSRIPPRTLGEAGPREGAQRHFQTFMGSRLPTDGCGDWDPQVRLKDMDEEGSDVHFIVHTAGAGHPDPEMEREFIRADHRYMDNFCSADPHRLKTCITVTPEDIELSIEEIKRWGSKPWAVAVHPHLPLDYPIDHPDMNPVWAAACDEGLAVIHHSFGTGYPGYRDLWGSPFLGRLAGHPWGAMRAVAAFFGSGLMDRYPTIRYGILESGFGWLPFWGKRMDDQAIYMGYVAENLQHKLSEYMTGGRFFAATVLHEGEDMVQMVSDQLGDHVLMFGSDYPHSESRFPESVETVLGWDGLSHEAMQKLLWDNPVRFFGEP
jgi:predicted TIM-barrel fold metal-dependent hydrolase